MRSYIALVTFIVGLMPIFANAEFVTLSLSTDSVPVGADVIVTYEPIAFGGSNRSANYIQVIVQGHSTLVGYDSGLDVVLQENVQFPSGGGSGTVDGSHTYNIHLECNSGVSVCRGGIDRDALHLAGPGNINLNHQLSISKSGVPLKFSDGSTTIHLILP